MSSRKHIWVSLLCLLIAALLVYILHMMQLRQVQLQAGVQVVVPTRFIPAGTLLKPDMLAYRILLKDAYDPSMMQNMDEIIGQEAVLPLGLNEPLLSWKLNRLHLLPEQGQATFQIPKSYVLSISSGIRAGDQVAVYASGGTIANQRLFASNVVVASVKSTAYTEIDDIEQSHLLSKVRNNEEMMYLTRRNASAPIDHINLNLTEEQWLLIDSLCSSGETKLVIAFTGQYIVNHDAMIDNQGREHNG